MSHTVSLSKLASSIVKRDGMGAVIREAWESKRCSRTSFYLRGPVRPTIYAVKQQHILAVEKRSKDII